MPELVAGLRVVYDDDDIVVVDKPVGVAAHPSPGWTGPTVVGGLAAAGYRISTVGCGRAAGRRAPARRRDQRPDGRGQERGGVLRAQAGVPERTVDKTLPRARPGPPRPEHAARSTHRSTGTPRTTTSGRWSPAASRASRTTRRSRRFRAASLLEVHLETGRTHQIRVHMAALRHPCVGDLTYGADPVLARRLGLTRQWLHAVRLGVRAPRRPPPGRVHLAVPRRPGDRPGAGQGVTVTVTTLGTSCTNPWLSTAATAIV